MTENDLAFEVILDDHTCITFAATEKRARWQAVSAAKEAGYYEGRRWPLTLKTKRIPYLDSSVLKKDHAGRAFVPEYVRNYP